MPLSWFKRFSKPQSETSPTLSGDDGPSETLLDDDSRTEIRLDPESVQASEPWLQPPEPPKVKPIEIPTEKIAQRAYEKWVSRGCTSGSSDQDWLEAEAELRAEYESAAAERLPHRSR